MSWKSVRLGDVLTLKRGHDLPSHHRQQGEIPVVSSSGITGFHNVAKAEAPGVVTGRYGTLGEVFYLKQPFWPLNTALYVIDFKGNNPRFAAYFLKNVLVGHQSDKAAVPGVDRNVLHDLPVAVPECPVQLRIASVLSAYDDLIENNCRRIVLLEESARLLYREWFVSLRFPGYEHMTPVEGVPVGWELGTVADFYHTASGGTPSRERPDYFSGEIPWVKTQELPNGFVIDTEEKISDHALKNSAAKIFPARTVLLAMYGATIGQLGILSSSAACNQACCAILPKHLMANFAHAFLFFRENKEKLSALSLGAAQNNINQQIIRSFPMIMPSPSIMRAFKDDIEPIFNLWLNLQIQNQKLRTARDLLIPKLMSGDLVV